MFENDVWSIPILGRAPRALTHVRRLPTAVATPQRAVNVATGSRIRVRALSTSVRRSFTLIVLPASTTAVAWQVQAGSCARRTLIWMVRLRYQVTLRPAERHYAQAPEFG